MSSFQTCFYFCEMSVVITVKTFYIINLNAETFCPGEVQIHETLEADPGRAIWHVEFHANAHFTPRQCWFEGHFAGVRNMVGLTEYGAHIQSNQSMVRFISTHLLSSDSITLPSSPHACAAFLHCSPLLKPISLLLTFINPDVASSTFLHSLVEEVSSGLLHLGFLDD